jgi:uncharacterized 2Fe-2S/4Fe-4S cluster protein (DUF4445 family)
MSDNSPGSQDTLNSATTHRLILMPSGRQGDIPHGTTVLKAAESLGVEIESICGGRQTCGKCLVAVEEGTFPRHGITSSAASLTPPAETEMAYMRKHGISVDERRMSCMAEIVGDVLITVPEESQARKQVIRKAASDLTIEVAPAVRLYYVEVTPPVLGGPADWQRLQAALAEQWDLQDLSIDPLLLRTLQRTLRKSNWAVTVTVWQGTEVVRIAAGYDDGLSGVAGDVGSTTVAGHLVNLRTGAVLATESMMNPQVRFGEDLMSRVTYGMMEPQGVSRMNRAIIKALNDLTGRAAEAAGIEAGAITDVVLVGNTVMHHLLLGIDPVQLGQVPFPLATHDSVDIKARDLGLNTVAEAAMVHVLPCIAGHVGADNVGVLLAEQTHLDDEISLVVDIGTNAEILLGNRNRMLSASSPTGPALEGAHILHGQRAAPGAIERVRIDPDTGVVRYKVIGDDRWNDELDEGMKLSATGICGSGIIEVVAELFLAGLIDRTGRFAADAAERSPAVRFDGKLGQIVLAAAEETSTGQEIVVTQKDVRAIQLAKGALYAGAGAFGSYIDPRHAMVLGMLPDCDLASVTAVGNSAGDGARIALLNAEQRLVAGQAARAVEYVETGSESSFQDRFVQAMTLPHAHDSFPNLAGILPEAVLAANR